MRWAFGTALLTLAMAACVAIAVVNRQLVVLRLDPLHDDGATVAVPLYALVLASVAAGAVIGRAADRVSRRSGARGDAPGALGPRRRPSAGEKGEATPLRLAASQRVRDRGNRR